MLRWTGNGLADGTPITPANRNASGNGDSVTYSTGGTGGGLMVTAGDGVDIHGATTDIRRLDAIYTIATKQSLAQIHLTPKQAPSALEQLIMAKGSGDENLGSVGHATNGKLAVYNATGTGLASTPVGLVNGHKYRIDVIFAHAASPTTSNGRLVLRVVDLTDSTWNTSGDWWYDPGYAANLGTLDIAKLWMGKCSTSAIASSTPMRMEHLGWDVITSDLSVATTRSAVESFFMPDPYAAAPAPVARPVSVTANPGGWVTDTGAAPTGAALADESDSTYITNPGTAAAESITLKLGPLAAGPATIHLRALKPSSSVAPIRVELLEGSNVRASRDITSLTETATHDPVSGIADYTFDLTGTENSSIGDRGALALRIPANPA